MGSWSSNSPQILGNGCRSTQLETRILLLTRWMVTMPEASIGKGEGWSDRHDRRLGGSDRSLSTTILHSTCTSHLGRFSHHRSSILLGWTMVLHGIWKLFPLFHIITSSVVSQFGSAHVRISILWQVTESTGELLGHLSGNGRGIPQLSSYISVGLLCFRAWMEGWLQYSHRLHWFIRLDRLSHRSACRFQASDRSTYCTNRWQVNNATILEFNSKAETHLDGYVSRNDRNHMVIVALLVA